MGIAISRDTIHPSGLELGYKNPVLFDRHAVGGEYGAGFKIVGKGKLVTTFYPEEGGEAILIDERKLTDSENAAVTYHNPYDNIDELAHHFFSRSLAAEVTPYVVTKKTVFKWQEPFWRRMKKVFDASYRDKFRSKNLLKKTDNELAHLISDSATMQLIAWKDGGFSMVAHNYDGDMLTDEMSKVHRSPGFISSVLNGRRDDGKAIKEFEASHGTVSDMDQARLRGEETSLNPIGLADALIGAINHSAILAGKEKEILPFTSKLGTVMYKVMSDGRGTRDIAGAKGSTTEKFIEFVGKEL